MNKVIRYFREVRSELKKVVWPTRQEAIKLTILVIVGTILISLLIGVFDYIFTKILEFVLKA